VGIEWAYKSDGDNHMSMRTNYEFRRALARAVQNSNTEKELSIKIANVMLGEIDDILVRAWSHLGDMGLVASQFKRIRSAVRKRIRK